MMPAACTRRNRRRIAPLGARGARPHDALVLSRWLPRIFWIDGLSALGAGLVVLSVRATLVGWYGLSGALITAIGVVNLAYAPLGLWLAVRRRRPLALVTALACANYAWLAVCAVLVVSSWRDARPLGLAHILFEGAYVATLATIEWRNRHALVRR